MRVSGLGRNFSFFTPITAADALAFGADGKRQPVWILGNAAGTYFNVRHGEVTISDEDIEREFENFKSGLHPIRPQELPIDFEHLSIKPDRKPGDGVAAGWIRDMELRDNAEKSRKELWLSVEWNDDAAEAIKAKKYKGFSPLFHPNWVTHGKRELGSTLLGGALTNYQTIPDSVVTCSLDPGGSTGLASVEDLSYSDRERRVRDAISNRFPLVYRNGEVDYSSWVDVNYVFEDRVVFTRGGKTWRQEYTFNDDLTVSFDREPEETLLTDAPIAASNPHTGERTMKLKNAQGVDVEIPASSFAGLALDALAEIPAVADLRSKVPAAGSRSVPAAEFDTLTTTVQTLSTEVNALSTRATTAEAALKASKERERDALIDGLIHAGKIVPADKEHLVELANAAPVLFEKRITALKASQPVIALGVTHGSAGLPASNDAIVQFDAAIAAEKTADPKIAGDTAEAIKRAATKNPDLARARNVAMSLPVGAGGVPMTQN